MKRTFLWLPLLAVLGALFVLNSGGLLSLGSAPLEEESATVAPPGLRIAKLRVGGLF
ncbi:MAG: hypothetical protein ACE5JJ_06735 [Nitrospinota bacterium]